VDVSRDPTESGREGVVEDQGRRTFQAEGSARALRWHHAQ